MKRLLLAAGLVLTVIFAVAETGLDAIAFAIVIPALVEARNKYEAKQKEYGEWFGRFTKNGALDSELIKAAGMTSVSFGEEFRKHEAELGDLVKDFEHWKGIETSQTAIEQRQLAMAPSAGDGRTQPSEGEGDQKASGPINFGKAIVDSVAYKQRGRNGAPPGATAVLQGFGLNELKARFTRSAGWDPEERRSGLVVLDEQRPIQVVDMIPSIPTSLDLYKYMEETTFTNSAAEIAEQPGTTWGEATLILTERSQAIEKIAVYIPVTDEQLDDVEGAEAYINARLPFMISQRLDSQILNGNGVTPNLLGVLNATGLNTEARGSNNDFDAAHRALTVVRVTGRAIPSAYVIHSNDWQQFRLLRTSDGVYILGNPGQSAPLQLWGLPVVLSESLTEGTAVVGDWRNYAILVEKQGMDVQIGYVNDYFLRGLKAVRASIRVAVIWTRGTAFTQITGLFP